MVGENQSIVPHSREKMNYETVLFITAIAIVGFFAMAVGYPISGVPLLPLVAALQLIAGVRLGPRRGLIAAGVGALFADVFAYENFTLIHLISDPLLTGAPVNVLLPSFLLRLFSERIPLGQIDFRESGETSDETKTSFIISLFLVAMVSAAISPVFIGKESLVYEAATLLLFVIGILIFSSMVKGKKQNIYLLIALFIGCFMASFIGSGWQFRSTEWNAVIDTAVPWFLWDVIYSIIGLQFFTMLESKAAGKNIQPALSISKETRRRISFIVLMIASFLYLLAYFRYPPIGTSIYDEGISLYGAMRVMNGQIPYRDFWTQYAPGQFYMLALVFKTFGTSVLIERVWSTIVLFGITILIYLLTRLTVSKSFAVIAFLLSVIWLGGFHSYGSNVPPALLLSFLSCFFLFQFLHAHKKIWLFLSGTMAAAAALFRHDIGIYVLASQTMVLIPYIHLNRKSDEEFRRGRNALIGTIKVFLSSYLFGFLLVALPVALFFLVKVPLHELTYDLLIFPLTIFPKVRSLPYPEFFINPLRLVKGTIMPSVYWYTMFTNLWFSFPILIYGILIIIFVRQIFRKTLSWKSDEPWIFLQFTLMGLFFFNYASIRPDPGHLLATIFPTIILFVMVLHYLVSPKNMTIAKSSFFLLLLFAGFFPFKKPFVDHIDAINSACYSSSSTFGKGRAKGIKMGLEDEDYQAAIDYVDQHVPSNEDIYVGLKHHDKIYDNDIMFYFLADRNSATKYYELHPGLATQRRIQEQIRDDIIQHGVNIVVLLDRRWIEAPEPNESSKSSGCYLLDDFIREHFVTVAHFGDYEILKRRGSS